MKSENTQDRDYSDQRMKPRHGVRATAVIIDDNVLFAQILKEQLKKMTDEFGLILDITVISDPLQCLHDSKRYDLYFVDVEMPQLSGIDLVRMLHNKYIDAEFVFVSAYDKYIRTSIFVRPSAFIRKNYLQKDLHEAFPHLKKSLERKRDIICIKDHLKDVFIRPGEIKYLKSDGHYVHIFGVNEKIKIVRNNLKTLEKDLEPFDFLRIHLRYVVNLNYVEDYRRTSICLVGGVWLPVSDPHIKDQSNKVINWFIASI